MSSDCLFSKLLFAILSQSFSCKMDPREWPMAICGQAVSERRKGTRFSSHLRQEGLSVAMPLASALAHSAISKTAVLDDALLLDISGVIQRGGRDVANKRAVPQHVSQRTGGRLRFTQPFHARALSREHAREYIFDASRGHTLVLFQEPMWTSSRKKKKTSEEVLL